MITAKEAEQLTQKHNTDEKQIKCLEEIIEREIRSAAEKGESSAMVTITSPKAHSYADVITKKLKENGFTGWNTRDNGKCILIISW